MVARRSFLNIIVLALLLSLQVTEASHDPATTGTSACTNHTPEFSPVTLAVALAGVGALAFVVRKRLNAKK